MPLGTHPPADIINVELIVKRSDLTEVISHVGRSARCLAVGALRRILALSFSLYANLSSDWIRGSVMIPLAPELRVWKATLGRFDSARGLVRLADP